ncbi:hypothetical protein [Klebsiella pneumoniae]|uniref:hypothetical protein n=1 Tax=Klebsiella pneumoniae TaxID=573 RepID=UPI002FE1630E|nr:hypothetical protein [Klebsiella pneumoniae]HDH0204645.1 hypothetical protein [Klebsiella pneumoniae]
MSIKEISISHDRGFDSESKISDDLTLRRTLLFVTYSIIPVVALYYFSPYLAEATINAILSVGIELKYGMFFHYFATWTIFWGTVTVQRDLYAFVKKLYKGVKFLINKKGQ